MFKLVLEKEEEPEIKLPTAGSSKKQESSRRTSISALLTMPKPLIVWITINTGKFPQLQEATEPAAQQPQQAQKELQPTAVATELAQPEVQGPLAPVAPTAVASSTEKRLDGEPEPILHRLEAPEVRRTVAQQGKTSAGGEEGLDEGPELPAEQGEELPRSEPVVPQGGTTARATTEGGATEGAATAGAEQSRQAVAQAEQPQLQEIAPSQPDVPQRRTTAGVPRGQAPEESAQGTKQLGEARPREMGLLRRPPKPPVATASEPRRPIVPSEEIRWDSEDNYGQGAFAGYRRLRKPLLIQQMEERDEPRGTGRKPPAKAASGRRRTSSQGKRTAPAAKQAADKASSATVARAPAAAQIAREAGAKKVAAQKAKEANPQKDVPVIDITAETPQPAPKRAPARSRGATPEAIRMSRRLAHALVEDPEGIAEVNPFFKERLEEGTPVENPDKLDAMDLKVFEAERKELIKEAIQVDREYQREGRPKHRENAVLRAYALIPQRNTWEPRVAAVDDMWCDGRRCKHATLYAQLRCVRFNPPKFERGVLTFCDQWDFDPRDFRFHRGVPPSLFDLFDSEVFEKLSKSKKKQSLMSQALLDEANYGISSVFLTREVTKCLRFLEGEIDEDEFDRAKELAFRWRQRKFDPKEYRKQQRERRWLRTRRIQGRAIRAAVTDSEAELNALEESSEEEEEEEESEPEKVGHPPMVAVATQGPQGHLYVTLAWAGEHYRAMLDTGSTLTLFSAVKFIPAMFPGFDPNPPKKVVVQSASGSALTFMGKCDVLMAAGPTVARVEVWFTRELPVDALIGLNALRALSVSLFPVDEIGEVVVYTKEGALPLHQIDVSPVQLCALIRAHDAGESASSSVYCAGTGCPQEGLYEQLEEETGLRMHGHMITKCFVPASFAVTFSKVTRCYALRTGESSSSQALPQPVAQAETIPQHIEKLCAKANVSSEQQAKLRDLCFKYACIFNDGSKPLAKTNLAKFKVELTENRRPISCPPRAAGPAKREQMRLIVDQGLADGTIVPSESGWSRLW